MAGGQIKLVWSLSALLLWGSSADAVSQGPKPTVAVMVAGIGFYYVPLLVETACRRGTCHLTEEIAGLRHQIIFPAAVLNTKSVCTKAIAEPVAAANPITVTYHCGQVEITERFTKVQPTNEAGAVIRQAGSWLLCNAGANSYTCGNEVRMTVNRQVRLSDAAIERWLSL